jgi:hypothetical protein
VKPSGIGPGPVDACWRDAVVAAAGTLDSHGGSFWTGIYLVH